jgi:hypothetical protein
MLKKWFAPLSLLLLLILAIVLPGCAQVGSAINGSGKIIDRNIDMAGFDSVEAQGKLNLAISESDSFQITISTDDNLINRVLFTREDNILKIQIEAPAAFFPTSLKIKIGMPQIKNLNLANEASATIAVNKSVSSFNLVLTGSSIVDGYLEAESTNFYVSGNSQVNLKGKSKMLELDVAGASKLNLSNFLLSGANVKLREASIAVLNVNGDLNIVLKEASKIYYLGNPLIKNTSITGDSSMIRQ